MSFGNPKKRFSQNFLIDNNIARKIIDQLEIKETDTVFEIGTGRGALTDIIAKIGCALYSFELDAPLFEKIIRNYHKHPQVEVINMDFLKVNPSDYHDGKFKLIGNIPYDITSPLIDWIVSNRQKISRVVITTQKELAERISSGSGSKNWAPISILTQCFFDIEYAFTISPDAFFPKPKIDSATMILTKHSRYEIENFEQFSSVVREAFRQRRKQMLNNLSTAFGFDKSVLLKIFEQLEFSGTIRAEQVTIEQFIELTKRLSPLISS